MSDMDIIARQQAREQKLKRYFTGKPCRNGHLSERYVSTGQCKQCVDNHTAAKSPEEQERLRGIRRKWERQKIQSEPRYYADRAYARLNADRDAWNAAARARDKALTQARGAHRSTLRRRSDLSVRMQANLQRRLLKAVGGSVHKTATTMKLVGCSRTQLRDHLAGLFSDGMTWENYGEWHIDHIQPCASFDLTDPEQQKLCFHYTNLQPLWGQDNLSKGARTDWKPATA
jgi:hypothetical protein